MTSGAVGGMNKASLVASPSSRSDMTIERAECRPELDAENLVSQRRVLVMFDGKLLLDDTRVRIVKAGRGSVSSMNRRLPCERVSCSLDLGASVALGAVLVRCLYALHCIMMEDKDGSLSAIIPNA